MFESPRPDHFRANYASPRKRNEESPETRERVSKFMVRHYHKNEGDNIVWHDGSLADCPETEWVDWIILDDGRTARMAIGMSVSLPPKTATRFRYIDSVPPIS